MLTVFKKAERQIDNLEGYVELKEGLEDKPFLITIGSNAKENYSLLAYSVIAARIYNSTDGGAKFKLDSFPANFLSFSSDNEETEINDLVNNYLYPFLTCNGMDLEKLRIQARKMNFATFAGGYTKYKNIEKLLIENLKRDGLSNDDIDDLLSNISMVAIASEKWSSNDNLKTYTNYIIDANDKKCGSYENAIKYIENNSISHIFGLVKKGHENAVFFYDGDGKHAIDSYFNKQDDSFLAVAVFLTYILKKSINGVYGSNHLLISAAYSRYSNPSTEEALANFDNDLFFEGAYKLNDEEIALRANLDKACKALAIANKNATAPQLSDYSSAILAKAKELMTDNTYTRLLVELGIVKEYDPAILSTKSDREIIEAFKSLLGIPEKGWELKK